MQFNKCMMSAHAIIKYLHYKQYDKFVKGL